MISQFDSILDEDTQNIDQISANRVKVMPLRLITDLLNDNSRQKIKKRHYTLKELTNHKKQCLQNRKNQSADFSIGSFSFQASLVGQQVLQNTVGANKRQNSVKRRSFRKKLQIQKKPTSFSPLNGKGIYKLQDGSTVFGQWNEGELMGKGNIIYPNGNVYSGQLKKYERHGKGILKYKNGCRYEGKFSNGKFQGQGTLFNEFGQIINGGMWKNGVLLEEDI